MEVNQRRILVAGMARSGIGAAKLLLKHGAHPVLADSKPRESFGDALDDLERAGCETRLGEDQLKLLENVDGVVISPGIPIQSPLVKRAKELGLPLIGEMELGAEFLPGLMVAITGTNGKTTTTTLTRDIFRDAGFVAYAAGNIGYPVSEVAASDGPVEVTVIEVSSFQLESIESFHPHAAALLNITEDHLNRHGTMAEYIRMKARIFENQTTEDFAILNGEDPLVMDLAKEIKSRICLFSRTREVALGTCVKDGWIVWMENGEATPICPADHLLIPGPHNLENALAAAAMAYVCGVSPENIRKTLETFQGVEHRIETVRTVDGVTYINDSKGTNVDSTIKAVQSMKAPTVILLGGYDKHTDFMPLCREMVQSPWISHAVVMGDTADQITRQLGEAGYTAITRADNMRDAILKGKKLAVEGGNVLLSPACASFDAFKDFEERGRVFKQIVNEL